MISLKPSLSHFPSPLYIWLTSLNVRTHTTNFDRVAFILLLVLLPLSIPFHSYHLTCLPSCTYTYTTFNQRFSQYRNRMNLFEILKSFSPSFDWCVYIRSVRGTNPHLIMQNAVSTKYWCWTREKLNKLNHHHRHHFIRAAVTATTIAFASHHICTRWCIWFSYTSISIERSQWIWIFESI